MLGCLDWKRVRVHGSELKHITLFDTGEVTGEFGEVDLALLISERQFVINFLVDHKKRVGQKFNSLVNVLNLQDSVVLVKVGVLGVTVEPVHSFD
jgi:hypothetical protein